MNIIKRIGKSILCVKLEYQVKKLRKKHSFKVIAVAGSVGKTSTKLAIAQVLGTKEAVRYQDGNYNDRLTVPLIFFDQTEPAIFNVMAWFKILRQNNKLIKGDYPYKYIVVELGTDGPGQLEKFAYLKPDIVVLAAIAPEHMSYFGTLDAVAAEELEVRKYAQKLLINTDDTPAKYLQGIDYIGYGLNGGTYQLNVSARSDLQAPKGSLQISSNEKIDVQLATIGSQGAKISLGAAAVAHLLGFTYDEIKSGLLAIKPVPGRMQILAGINNSTIIDDTYNASPIAVKAALEVLYAAESPQRIAILGSMNELGASSQALHEEVANYCDPQKLSLLVTIGKDANQYIAPIATSKGCKVMSFDDPNKAGQYLAPILQELAIVLAKGSQNGVFAEETIKPLLANSADSQKLVRQSEYWMNVKRQQFPPAG